jgi:Cu-Zn family superoxide dismutase
MKKAVVVIIAAVCSFSPTLAAEKQTATAVFIGADGKDVGKAVLTGSKTGVLLELQVSGLPANKWVAFHIHENGKCDPANGNESAGGHFNPDKAEHGLLAANGPHAGDMPNQLVGEDGTLQAQVFNSMVSLDDKNAIRGRTLIIHENSDDYRSQPSGGAGRRLACAVIK